MQETSCRVLKYNIDWGLHTQLSRFSNVLTDTVDLLCGRAGDVALAEVVSRTVDLAVSEIGQVDWSPRLGCAISVTVEDVDTKNGLLGLDEREESEEDS